MNVCVSLASSLSKDNGPGLVDKTFALATKPEHPFWIEDGINIRMKISVVLVVFFLREDGENCNRKARITTNLTLNLAQSGQSEPNRRNTLPSDQY